jgi:ankyrin repeat protein
LARCTCLQSISLGNQEQRNTWPAGANAAARDSLGATALHRACSALQQPVVDCLLDAEPKLVNMADAQGNTPLHVTVSVGQDPRSIEIARVLVRRGADLTIKNKEGEGALDLFGDKLPASIASALQRDEDMATEQR